MTDNGAPDRVFGSDRPKSFEVLGETFHLRRVKPEAWAEVLRQADQAAESEEQTLEKILAGRDDRILLSIVPEEHDRWRELRSRDHDPLELRDMDEIQSWLTEVHTGRPTASASPSSDGPGSTGRSSKAQSSSPVARPS